MKIQILDEARQDLIQGFRFYENREPGLGLISFPFAIYYHVDEDLVRVHAVLDCRKDPL